MKKYLISFVLISSVLSAWTPEEMMAVKNVSDVQISPDHQKALFVVTEAIVEENVNRSKIYLGNSNCISHKIFSDPSVDAVQPRWSPDGKWIAYIISSSEKSSLCLSDDQGIETIVLISGKDKVLSFAWSPDSQKIACIISVQKQKNQDSPFEYGKASHVNKLAVIDLTTSLFQELTSDSYCIRAIPDGRGIREYDWSPDGTSISFAYCSSSSIDELFIESKLATVDVTTGEIFFWQNQARKEFLPRYSPDGQFIAYLHDDGKEKYSISCQVAIASKDGKERKLLAKTFNEGIYLNGPNLLGWTSDGNGVLFFEPNGTKYHLTILDKNSLYVENIDIKDLHFTDPELSYDRNYLGFVGQTLNNAPEAYITSLEDISPQKISEVNEFSQPPIHTEVIKWSSLDGVIIEGLLTYPVNYDPQKQYPLLLVIHGGPMAFFDQSFVANPYPYPTAAFAEEGFLVLRPNPRGSTGYGKIFRCANYGDWGGMDYIDLMSGIDHLIDEKIADPEKLGIMGWSYGGYMTAWTIGHTSRFKAASMGAGLSNLISMNGTSDVNYFLTDYLGPFHENPGLYEKLSPLYYAKDVSTPCLIQHGTDDQRVPISQSYEFYHELKRLGKSSTLILYPGMNHGISQPKFMLDAMHRNLDWFKKKIQEDCQNLQTDGLTQS